MTHTPVSRTTSIQGGILANSSSAPKSYLAHNQPETKNTYGMGKWTVCVLEDSGGIVFLVRCSVKEGPGTGLCEHTHE